MSLDVSLYRQVMCPHCAGDISGIETDTCVFDRNITHNLNKMAEAAGTYMHMWRPEEIGITHARQLIEPLKEGLAKLKADPEYYEQYNAKNGWGLYENFVPFVEQYLEACMEHPDARIEVYG